MTRPRRRRLRGLERAGAWLLTPVVVLLVPVTGFEAYALHSRLTPTTYERGGAFQAGPATLPGQLALPSGAAAPAGGLRPATGAPPSDSSAGSATAPAAGSGTNGASARSGAAPTVATTTPLSVTSTVPVGPVTSATVRPPAAHATPGRTVASPATASAATHPAVGTYGVSVTGTESASFGPIGVCNQTLPSSTTLTISPASDDSPTSYSFDLRFYPGQADKHDERHIYKYSPAQVVVDYEQATVTCGGVKQSTTLPYSPPQVRVQLPLSIGATWHSHGGSPDRIEDATSTVTGTDTITIGGTAYPVWIIKTDVAMSGPESGARTQAWWYSPQLAMPLRIYEKISAHKSGGTYNNEYTATITSLPR